jgi:hypothetical protein
VWELSLYSAITLPFPDETISIEILYCACSHMHFSYIFSPYVSLETMLTRHQEGCDVYSEDMHVTWFQGPDSVSKHLDGEIYCNCNLFHIQVDPQYRSKQPKDIECVTINT